MIETKKALNLKPEGRQNQGRPKLRSQDDVEEDLRTRGIKEWRVKALNREEWYKITRHANSELIVP